VTDDDRATAALLARLRGEIAADRTLMRRCVADAAVARARLGEVADDPAVLALAAVALHGFYTGTESILERVARLVDREVPEGDRWHRELLAQACVDVEGVRPALVPPSLMRDLGDLLGFRHFFRQAYGIVLEPTRVVPLLATLERVAPALESAFDAFDAFLARAARVG
jgi:hypothetical protein